MIYTVIADISEFNAEKFLSACECDNAEDDKKTGEISPLFSACYSAPKIRGELIEHIKSVSNERLKKERCGAYLLLSAIVKNMIGYMPDVVFSQNGKPSFGSKSEINFNLSHTTDFVAVSISDVGSVGVDIEAEISSERASRLESRFFSDLTINTRPIDVSYAFCKINEDGDIQLWSSGKDNFNEVILGDVKISRVNQTFSFGARWTLYEASLKCNGGGFTSLPCLGMLLLEAKADTVQILKGHGEFFVTTTSV